MTLAEHTCINVLETKLCLEQKCFGIRNVFVGIKTILGQKWFGTKMFWTKNVPTSKFFDIKFYWTHQSLDPILFELKIILRGTLTFFRLIFLTKNMFGSKISQIQIFLFLNFLDQNFVQSKSAYLFLTNKFGQFQMNIYQAWLNQSLQCNSHGLNSVPAQSSLFKIMRSNFFCKHSYF